MLFWIVFVLVGFPGINGACRSYKNKMNVSYFRIPRGLPIHFRDILVRVVFMVCFTTFCKGSYGKPFFKCFYK